MEQNNTQKMRVDGVEQILYYKGLQWFILF